LPYFAFSFYPEYFPLVHRLLVDNENWWIFMKTLKSIGQTVAILLFCAAIPAGAQDMIVGGAAAEPLSANDLEQLLRPIALYPDPLLAEIFTAATLPSQIVLADRYLGSGGDPAQAAVQPWDPSVQALVHYPTVLKWLDDNLPWTTEVGEAFLDQQQDVMDSIQHLRFMAQGEGNLPSTPQENVVNDGGVVEIEPVNPEIIYVPTYPWDTIYYDPGINCSFGVGFPIGLWLPYDWDWRHHHVFAWGPGHPRPGNWWTQPGRNRVAPRGVTVWHGPGRVANGGAGRADRGFAPETFRPARLTAPAAPAPPVGRAAVAPSANRPGIVLPTGRAAVAPSANRPGIVPNSSGEIRIGAAPQTWQNLSRGVTAPSTSSAHAPESRAPSGGGAFGGSESSSEARQSSVRGVESRSSTPASAPAQSSRPSQSSGSSSRSSSGSSRGR
jgi:hypothetical protein